MATDAEKNIATGLQGLQGLLLQLLIVKSLRTVLFYPQVQMMNNLKETWCPCMLLM